MMVTSVWQIAGIVLAVLLIEFVGIMSVKKVKNASDFTTGGGRAGLWVVVGTIMGTLVGGQSTIGTAQLSFSYGISAWWFTVGAALGCVVLGIGYAIPLRYSGSTTLMEVISKEYGKKAEMTGSVLCSLGMFVSIVAQVLSAGALLMTLFPVNMHTAALLSAVVMVIYVVFGGVWSAGIGGIVKLILLSLSALAGGVMVLVFSGGCSGLMDSVIHLLNDTDISAVTDFNSKEEIIYRYTNIFSRGASKDICSCISVILGVLATQSYAQGIWAAKTDSVARKACMLSAVLTIPIGVACALVGMYMRANYVTSEESQRLAEMGLTLPEGIGVMRNSAQAFPVFITDHLPEFLGGVVLGVLLITVIIGGSGLTLGAATIIVRDVFMRLSSRFKDVKSNIMLSRCTIVLILSLAMITASSFSGTFINDLGFLSMGLRTTAAFVPLTLALFLPGRFNYKWIFISIIAGTVALVVSNIINPPFDPLFAGLGVSLLCCLIGYKWKKDVN